VLVLTMLGALTLGPVTAAFATPPAGEGDCVSPDTPVHEVLDQQELAALLQALVEQLAVARPDLGAADREQFVASLLLAGAGDQAAAPAAPAGTEALAAQVMARYQALTVGQVADLLAQATTALDVVLLRLEDQAQAAQIKAVFGAFVVQVLTALDFYDCEDDGATPAPTPSASEGTATPSPAATASPAAYASPTPESATAGLADTGLATPALAGLVALALSVGAVLLGVTARPRAGR
jgi:hypothetical protein